MPQMMPINWLIYLFFFIYIFILFNIINYYIFNYTLKFKNITKIFNNKPNFPWKW